MLNDTQPVQSAPVMFLFVMPMAPFSMKFAHVLPIKGECSFSAVIDRSIQFSRKAIGVVLSHKLANKGRMFLFSCGLLLAPLEIIWALGIRVRPFDMHAFEYAQAAAKQIEWLVY
jgi:hypothetical protein